MSGTIFKIRKLVNKLSYGIEIECQVRMNQWYSTYGEYFGFWFITEDGSIIPDLEYKDYEFVSQPLPIVWLKREIEKLGKKVPFKAVNGGGIHIHVNKEALSKKKIQKIIDFLKSLSLMDRKKFFGRGSEYFNDYYAREDSRYRMINTTNKSTVEFRLFASGDTAWASYCVSMTDYLVRNANHLHLDGIEAFFDSYFIG